MVPGEIILHSDWSSRSTYRVMTFYMRNALVSARVAASSKYSNPPVGPTSSATVAIASPAYTYLRWAVETCIICGNPRTPIGPPVSSESMGHGIKTKR